jgi:hypothetical protein
MGGKISNTMSSSTACGYANKGTLGHQTLRL